MRRTVLAGLGILVVLLLSLLAAQARDKHVVVPIETITVAQLPPEARETLQRIKQGGPFPYDRDGIEFKNRERRLPPRERGYYREYTVKTPGISHRGPRRIVCGVLPECYYTDDHYRSFKRIKE